MAFELSLAAVALAVIAQLSPGVDMPTSGAQPGSFVALADELDVVTVAPPPPTQDNSSGIPEPGAWSMVLMGLGVVAVFAMRSRR